MPYPVYWPILGTVGGCTSYCMTESVSFHNHSVNHLVPQHFLNIGKALSFQVLPHPGLHQAGCWWLSFPICIQVKALESSQNEPSSLHMSQNPLDPPMSVRAAYARVGVKAKPLTSNYCSLKSQGPFSGPKGQELVDVPSRRLGLKQMCRCWQC